MTLRQLEAFLAVGHTLSFSEAARQVHLSQPALSATVRKLEEKVSAQLFDRTTRHVALTPVGTELLGAVEGLFENFDSAFAGIRDFVEGKRGRLAIAASPSLAAAFLPEVIVAFEAVHPAVVVQVHDVLSDVALEMVRQGVVDLALAPATGSEHDLTQRELFQDSLVLLCHDQHPLARSRTVTWQQLQPHRLVSLTGTSSVRHLMEATYLQQGHPLKPAFEVEHASTVIGFVANGLAVGILPLSLLPLVRVGQVTIRRVVKPEIQRTISALTLKGRTPSPAATGFLELCAEFAQRHASANRGRNTR
ncbi:LysR family transcriptional regulator [Cupriavidus sp. 2TAF22]|uniref:LysR family transcriptional regulator n=1 Tax=unclassified Cupriavidus TaxID=2640874 RepID=UPI003F927012